MVYIRVPADEGLLMFRGLECFLLATMLNHHISACVGRGEGDEEGAELAGDFLGIGMAFEHVTALINEHLVYLCPNW